jgi:drug/metabolite transporter (DMT)-like permease
MRVYIAFLVVLVSWSTTPIAIQFSSDGIHFSAALELRWLIAFSIAAITLLAIGQRIPLDRQSIIADMVIAIPMTIGMCLTYCGAQRLRSGLIALFLTVVGFAMNAVAVKTVGKNLSAFDQVAGVMAAQFVFTFPVWFFYTPQPSGKSMAAIVGAVVTYAAYNYMLKNMRTVNSRLVRLLSPVFPSIIGAKLAEETQS